MFITTKYLGPTNSRGGRVKASTITGKSVTLPWDHAASVAVNHQLAAFDLAAKMEWPGDWVGVADKGGGYAFMHIDAPSRFTVVV